MLVGVDVGKKHLAWCVVSEGVVRQWVLADLLEGTASAMAAVPPFKGAGKRGTIQHVINAMVAHLDAALPPGVERVHIEAQLGMANLGAKTLSHAIQTYFLCRHGAEVLFLRPHGSTREKTTYAARKRAAVEAAEDALADQPAAVEFLARHPKKDDLADAALLAL